MAMRSHIREGKVPEPRWVHVGVVARALPLTYANEALTNIMIRGKGLAETALQIGVLLLFAALMVVLASLTLRREVA